MYIFDELNTLANFPVKCAPPNFVESSFVEHANYLRGTKRNLFRQYLILAQLFATQDRLLQR